MNPQPDASQTELNRSGPDEPRAEDLQVTPAQRQRQLAAVKHGLYVRAPSGLRLRDRRVRRLVRKVWPKLPWLQSSDASVVRSWAELEIVCANYFVLVKGGTASESQTDLWRRLKALKLTHERELGMTPMARAELGLTVTRQRDLARELSGLDGEG